MNQIGRTTEYPKPGILPVCINGRQPQNRSDIGSVPGNDPSMQHRTIQLLMFSVQLNQSSKLGEMLQADFHLRPDRKQNDFVI